MIGALPAIGFLSVGMGMSPLAMGLGALSTLAGGLTGPDYTEAGRLPAYSDLAAPTGNFSAYLSQSSTAYPELSSYYAQYSQALSQAYGAYPAQPVSYSTPQSYPVSYGTGVASYDARSAFSHPYVYGSQAGYQGSFGGYSPYSGYGSYGGSYPGYSTGAYQAPAYGYSQQPSYGYGSQFGSYYSGTGSYPSYSSSYSYGASSSYGSGSGAKIELGPTATIENGMVKYPYLPVFSNVDNWPIVSQAVKDRLVGGSPAEQQAVHFGGTPPFDNSDGLAAERTTVWWALQANDQLRYNVDTKTFFMTYPDGRTRDIDTLANLMNVRRRDWNSYATFQQHMDVTKMVMNRAYRPGYG